VTSPERSRCGPSGCSNIGSVPAPFEVKAPPQWRVLSANLTDKDHVNTGVAVPESLPADSFGVITFVRE